MRGTHPLGLVAIGAALLCVLIVVVAAPFELRLQLTGEPVFSAVVFAIAGLVVLVAAVAIVLAVVAIRRSAARAVPGAAIGIAGYLLIGQVVGVAATAIVSLA